MSTQTPPTDWSAHWTDQQLAERRADESDGPRIDKAESFAWAMLAALTAYQIGTFPISVRPCAAQCTPETGYLTASVQSGGGFPLATIGRPFPFISGGRWYNACACRTSDCSCTELSEVLLPGPVGGMVSVTIDGAALPTSAYRVDNGYRLVRLDGEQWPACQDMAAGEGDVGSFVVTYYRGAAPNLMTRAAAGALAWEFYEALSGNECRLPWNVVSMTRQGESYDFGEGGMETTVEGIPEVAAVVRVYNPFGHKVPPRVIAPGVQSARVTTWQS